MQRVLSVLLGIVCWAAMGYAQTAEELVAKNTEAKGGYEKIKALNSLRMVGTYQEGNLMAQVKEESKAPDQIRQSLTLQGMTQVQAYDGTTGWQISPFAGRKDPELLGEDDLRDLEEDADFYGPLIDYKEKGNTVAFLGKDTLEGDDVYRLKVTLKNGDIINYFLDPETFIEIRTETQQFIRGSVRERVTDLGSYKQVNGVYFPFSLEVGPKQRPQERVKITYTRIEGNVPLDDALFKMPAPPAVPSPQKHAQPPAQKQEPPKPPDVKPPTLD